MRHHFLLFATLGLVAGCSEYDFSSKEEDPEPPLETGSPPPTDVEDSGETGDSSVVVDTDPVCPPSSFPPEPLKGEGCYVPPKTGTFTPVIEWTKASWSVQPGYDEVMMTPIVASLTDDDGDGDIDDEDVPDILLVTYQSSDGLLRAISGADGAELWTVTSPQMEGQSTPAAADIDGDGVVEIIVPTAQHELAAFEHDGTPKWRSVPLGAHVDEYSNTVAVSDMEHDGDPEIIFGRAILDVDGNVRATGSFGRGYPSSSFAAVGVTSFAVDVDQDGVEEVVVGNALYRPDGSAIWSNGQQDGYPGVANFDSDPSAEIVVTGNGLIRLQDDDGSVLWSQSIPGAAGGYGGPPTIADYDGDGAPEVGVAAYSSYSVFDTDGSLMWQMPTQDGSSGVTGSAVFDFEADGIAEAVYADETRLWVFNGPDGMVKLESSDHSNATWNEYPSIADVDADGHAEIIVPNTGSYTGVTVIGDLDDSWRPGGRIWNQHAYFITNIGEDGTIPTTAASNWLEGYNSFRSGDLSPVEGSDSPDLMVEIVDVCRLDCEGGGMPISVRAGNVGNVDYEEDVLVEIFALTDSGGAPVAEVLIPGPIRSGTWEAAVELELSGYEGQGWVDLLASVGTPDGSELEECDLDNNSDQWGEDLCE